MQELYDYLSNKVLLSPDAKDYLNTITSVKEYKKGRVLIKQNQLVNKIFFVLDGCLRSFVYDRNGKEHTLRFAVKNWWISDFIAIYFQEKSSQIVECIKDSRLVEFDVQNLDKFMLLYPEFGDFHRRNMERHIASLHSRILNQLQLSSREQYELFVEQHPDIEKHAMNYHIASYLGITQQSLSRIRSEIKN